MPGPPCSARRPKSREWIGPRKSRAAYGPCRGCVRSRRCGRRAMHGSPRRAAVSMAGDAREQHPLRPAPQRLLSPSVQPFWVGTAPQVDGHRGRPRRRERSARPTSVVRRRPALRVGSTGPRGCDLHLRSPSESQVSGLRPRDRVTWEARQTLTTLEATRPGSGIAPARTSRAPSGPGRTRCPW